MADELCSQTCTVTGVPEPSPTVSPAPLTGGVVPHTIEELGAGSSHQLSHRAPGPARPDQIHRGIALGTCKDEVHVGEPPWATSRLWKGKDF